MNSRIVRSRSFSLSSSDRGRSSVIDSRESRETQRRKRSAPPNLLKDVGQRYSRLDQIRLDIQKRFMENRVESGRKAGFMMFCHELLNTSFSAFITDNEDSVYDHAVEDCIRTITTYPRNFHKMTPSKVDQEFRLVHEVLNQRNDIKNRLVNEFQQSQANRQLLQQ